MWISDEIWKEGREEKGCAIFETFRTDGPRAFLVVSRSRWDKDQKRLNAPRRQNSSASSSERQWQAGLEEEGVDWSSLERKGHGSSGELPGKLRPHKSGHRGLGALDGARRTKMSLSEVHPEGLDERRQQYFPAF